MLAYCDEKKQRLSELEDYDSFMQKLDGKIQKALDKVSDISEKLHSVRERAARELEREIGSQMKELNFADAWFEIRLIDTGRYSALGRDDAEFYMSANPGEPLKPLGSVASGGELSRVMLAIKTVLADEEDTPH